MHLVLKFSKLHTDFHFKFYGSFASNHGSRSFLFHKISEVDVYKVTDREKRKTLVKAYTLKSHKRVLILE